MPICKSEDITVQSVNEWIDAQKQEHKEIYVIYRRIYWYCHTFSCVLVHRSQEWFAAARPKIEALWEIIDNERVNGFEHRLPKKTVKKISPEHKCLINIDTLE
jgi:hypothetical protein